MKRYRRWVVRASAVVVLLIGLTAGTMVRRVAWEGDAPIGFGAMARVNAQLLGRPFWWATPQRVEAWLKGELVGSVKVRWRFPHTVVITAQAPRLLGIVPQGDKGALVDCHGRRWVQVPLTATGFPLLLLPPRESVQKCMPAVYQTLTVCARERVPVRAVWVSQFGEVAVCLPDNTWLRLGNRFALPMKVRLGIALRKQMGLTPPWVADLSGLTAISVWYQTRP
ncbi:hypothetical protein HRbin17_01617 [bacterium HR17]|uniref:Cell division protein FtsQ n=1 Tax=Candidatus Fervidibacter japonicus TaxID=2035412 RepID=A0A2H5XD45_9BACT|nr:hypothetical protein HRbin17_01617 [bacterium HR17]